MGGTWCLGGDELVDVPAVLHHAVAERDVEVARHLHPAMTSTNRDGGGGLGSAWCLLTAREHPPFPRHVILLKRPPVPAWP